MSIREHGGKTPGVAELEKYVREKTRLEFWVSTGDRISGKLRWFDDEAFALSDDAGDAVTLLKSSVIGYKPATT